MSDQAPNRRIVLTMVSLAATAVALTLAAAWWVYRQGPFEVFIHDTYFIVDWASVAWLAIPLAAMGLTWLWLRKRARP